MVAPSPPAPAPAPASAYASEDPPEATRVNWRLMRSVALASLVPFFLLSAGYYYSLSLLVLDYLEAMGSGGSFSLVKILLDSRDQPADAFVGTVAAISAISFVLMCSSVVASVSTSAEINSSRRLSLVESFSKVRGRWREPMSLARLYFTILFLGYVLSQIAVVVVVALVTAGDSLSRSTSHILLSPLPLLLSLYFGTLMSVASSNFAVEEGGCGVAALWDAGPARMEEMKLQGFIVFFVSVIIAHGLLLVGHGLVGGGAYGAGMVAIPFHLGAVLINILWMLGARGLLVYVGVLLKV